ncbi:hypothetical protein QBC46DRAFT_137167 [Diplogelasinospora grovesii]|uniref:Myb-like domain-containing protein n=1 Tax=Diplogelasinospora grovesii TaxID=303347 RepID=A0AAN6N6B3_9PEZI|nr:hypothetical protein QBC46DRAFT_137167 [Diplogelasinospora grovesii]
MPKLTRAPSHHQYSHSQPQIPVALAPQQAQIAPAAMSYYQTARPVSGYYGDLSATGPGGPMTMASYDAYGVPTSLHQMPTAAASASAATMGGPVGGPPLPAQHRASSGAWNPDDDQALLQLRAMGKNWNQIQREAFPSKTGNACRKRHERLMERRGQNDFDNRKLERLSKEYMSMRKEIWQPLAARCGEKWNVVEAQCMSNGLKNIQSHARAFARRERLETGGHHHIPGVGTGYDDDSGVSGIGGAMTPIDEDLNNPHESYGHSPDPSGGGGGGGSSTAQSTPPGSNGSSTASQHTYHAPIHGGHYSLAAYQQVVGGYHQQQQHHPHHHHHHHHGYSNSMSSTGSTAAGYSNNNQGAQSPYMGHNNRLPSVGDMGIDAIINRGSGGNNQQL